MAAHLDYQPKHSNNLKKESLLSAVSAVSSSSNSTCGSNSQNDKLKIKPARQLEVERANTMTIDLKADS